VLQESHAEGHLARISGRLERACGAV
ncbi:MAG: hypothetical protein QOI36_618, partial [Pseudonocardiales bacterium]|nr:hypothetical protein [Pseudonocardiales bacterium]